MVFSVKEAETNKIHHTRKKKSPPPPNYRNMTENEKGRCSKLNDVGELYVKPKIWILCHDNDAHKKVDEQ